VVGSAVLGREIVEALVASTKFELDLENAEVKVESMPKVRAFGRFFSVGA
jgi:hypothetical protein